MKKGSKEINFQDYIKFERNFINTCSTSIGVLHRLPALLEKIQLHPGTMGVIYRAEKQIEEEDLHIHEDSRKTYAWFCERFRRLLEVVNIWNSSNQELRLFIEEGVLRYNFLGGDGGYFQTIKNLFYQVNYEASLDKSCHSMICEWVRINHFPVRDLSDIDILFPDYVKKQVDKKSFQAELHLWKPKLDLSLSESFRFLKILSQYESFIHISSELADRTCPKNFDEFENLQYKYYVGSFLNRFKSPDHQPLTKQELTTLVDHFVCLVEEESAILKSNGPLSQKVRFLMIEEMCIKWLIVHVLAMSDDERKRLGRGAYVDWALNFLREKAKEDNPTFVDDITNKMITKHVGPEVNKMLRDEYNIVIYPQRNNKKLDTIES